MNHFCIHAIVKGHVQGVFYRDSTRKKAEQLNITGWVKNKKEGSVEIFACGNEQSLEEFIDWLYIGPPHAKVTEVEWQRTINKMHEKFIILHE